MSTRKGWRSLTEPPGLPSIRISRLDRLVHRGRRSSPFGVPLRCEQSHSRRYSMSLRLTLPLILSATVATGLLAPNSGAAQAPGEGGGVSSPGVARALELSTDSRLADRRSYVIGDRFYEVGAEDGTYPAEGWHTQGEMGGFWSMPIKLLDGV